MDAQQEQDLAGLPVGEPIAVTVKLPSISNPSWTYGGQVERVDIGARTLLLTVTYERERYRVNINQDPGNYMYTEKSVYRFDDILSWRRLRQTQEPPPPPPPPVDLPVFSGTRDDIDRYPIDPAGLPDGFYPHSQFANVYWAVLAGQYVYPRDPCPPGFIFDIDSQTCALPQDGRTEAPQIFEHY